MWYHRGRMLALGLAAAALSSIGGSGVAVAQDNDADAHEEEAAAAAVADQPVERIEHRVGPEETLGSIALRYRVSVAALRHWNGLADELAVEPGTKLVVQSPKAVPERPAPEEKTRRPPRPRVRYHKVRPGDTLGKIAKKYGVKLSKIRRHNRRINPRRLQIGQKVKVVMGKGSHYRSRPRSGQGSFGSSSGGYLFDAVSLPSVAGLTVRDQDRAWGTKRVVRLLEAAAADLKARWPYAPDLYVGDLSHKKGGYMPPHRSHQSGRDADLSYFHRGNVPLRGFMPMDEEIFDAAKNWHFFKVLIDTRQVHYIFVDYDLQKILYEYALSIGYTPDDLATVLQYPQGHGAMRGIIRHEPGHDDHFHIRFVCGPLDANCRD